MPPSSPETVTVVRRIFRELSGAVAEAVTACDFEDALFDLGGHMRQRA
ncbi:hypothetical protein ABIA33_007103 [Streptacidiphilus sp. MAP12-16]